MANYFLIERRPRQTDPEEVTGFLRSLQTPHPEQGSLEDLHFAHLKHGFSRQNQGTPPFTSCKVQVYNASGSLQKGQAPNSGMPGSKRRSMAATKLSQDLSRGLLVRLGGAWLESEVRSNGTFHFHSFQESFFLENFQKPREPGWVLNRRMVEKRNWNQPLDSRGI